MENCKTPEQWILVKEVFLFSCIFKIELKTSAPLIRFVVVLEAYHLWQAAPQNPHQTPESADDPGGCRAKSFSYIIVLSEIINGSRVMNGNQGNDK